MSIHVESLDDIPEGSLQFYEEDPSGGFRLRNIKRLSEMSEPEKMAFIRQHGLGAYTGLIKESTAAPKPVGPFESTDASQAYLREHGLDAWKRRLAEHRRR